MTPEVISYDPNFPRHRRLAAFVTARIPQGQLAHDALHVTRAYRWCLRLAYEQEACPDLAGAAGLLHDCVSIPKDSPDRPLAGEAASALAAGFLPEAGYTQAECEAIVEALRTCSWSRGLQATGALGRVLQDADRLDALGVIGMLRSASCAQEMAARTSGALYHADDPLGTQGRALEDRLAMLDHLECKLLHLLEHFHSPSAQAEAAKRHQVLLDLRDQLLHELAGIHAPCRGGYQTLLLDFDGTLVDSAPAIVACMRHAAASCQVHLDADDAPLRALIGRPLKDSLRTWGLEGDDLERAYNAYRQAWLDGARDQCRCFPGVRSVLKNLQERGCTLLIASAKDDERLPEAVQRIGLADCVDGAFGARPGETGKQALVQRARAASPNEAVAMVGDRCFDGEAAQAAGIPFLAASYGYGSRAELAACAPAAWLGHCSDLLACAAQR